MHGLMIATSPDVWANNVARSQKPQSQESRRYAARWREAELMGARLAITLVVGVIAACMTYFVLTYIGTDMTHSSAALIVIAIAAAFALVTFVRS
jgi:hypothetical protein